MSPARTHTQTHQIQLGAHAGNQLALFDDVACAKTQPRYAAVIDSDLLPRRGHSERVRSRANTPSGCRTPRPALASHLRRGADARPLRCSNGRPLTCHQATVLHACPVDTRVRQKRRLCSEVRPAVELLGDVLQHGPRPHRRICVCRPLAGARPLSAVLMIARQAGVFNAPGEHRGEKVAPPGERAQQKVPALLVEEGRHKHACVGCHLPLMRCGLSFDVLWNLHRRTHTSVSQPGRHVRSVDGP